MMKLLASDFTRSILLTERREKLGRIRDIYFDDQTWQVRYIALGNHHLFNEKDVILSPQAITLLDPVASEIHTDLEMDSVCVAPRKEPQAAVTWQYEQSLCRFFGLEEPSPEAGHDLHTFRDFRKFRAVSLTGGIGRIDNLIIDLDTWCIEQVVVELRNWISNKHVALDTSNILKIRWKPHYIIFDLKKHQVLSQPRFTPARVSAMPTLRAAH